MSTRKTLFICAALLLTACSRQTLQYDLSLETADPARALELIQASERMMKRRLAAAKAEKSEVTAVPTGGENGRLTIQVKNKDDADQARRILSEPFTFDIRLEKKGSASGDLVEFEPTGLVGDDLEWVNQVTSSTGQPGVELIFSPEGYAELKTIFEENEGLNIGIFVRDLLVSKMQIQGKILGKNIVISGIPSAKVAEVFSDDVNVGLKVKFTPVNQ